MTSELEVCYFMSMCNIIICIFAKLIQQAVTRSVQDELSKLEFKVMMQKRNVEQLENKIKLLELNLEEFKLEKMVHMCNIKLYASMYVYAVYLLSVIL